MARAGHRLRGQSRRGRRPRRRVRIAAMRRRASAWFFPLGFLLSVSAAGMWVALLAQGPPTDAEWPMHGGPDNIRYSPLAQINRDNVAKLQVAWTYDSHDAFKGSE